MPETAEAQTKPADAAIPPVEKRSFFAEHPIKSVVFLVFLIAAGIGGYRFLQYLGSYESTDDAQIDGDIYAITSRIAGTVKAVGVEDNQQIKLGQLLVDLDPRDYEMSVDQARTALNESRSQVAVARPAVPITSVSTETSVSTSGSDIAAVRAAIASAQRTYDATLADIRKAEADTRKADADVREAEADAAKAQADLVRYKRLIDKDEISRQQYDQADAAAKSAAAAVESKKASAESSKAAAESKKAAAEAAARKVEEAQIRLTQAQTRQAEAERNRPQQIAVQSAIVAGREATAAHQQTLLDWAQQSLSYTKIFAPADGIVGKKNVQPGQQVAAGQQLMAVVSIANLWVTANFKETQLREMHPGQRVTLRVDAFDRDYEGEVESVAGASGARFSLLPPENATGNYVKVVQRIPVRLRFKPGQDPNHLLRPGMSVEPKVWLDTK